MKYHTDFNQTKYTRWYYELVQHRQNNPAPKSEYRESHHIVPESFYINRKREGAKGWLEGNADAKENKVWLTGREHALCHWLLKKMTRHNTRAYELMVYSFNMMWVGGEHQGREMSRMITRAYERNRIEWSRIHSETMKGKEPWNKGLDMKDDARCKGGKKNKGKKHTEESIAQRTVTMKQNGNDKRSDETRAKMKESQTGIPKPKSKEFREQVSKTLTGKPKPEGHGDAVAAANRGRKIINKNGVEKRVKGDELQSYLDDGWSLGRFFITTGTRKKKQPA
jgi:hypothetical protein